MACEWVQLGIRFCMGAETKVPSAYIISTSDPFGNSLVESGQVDWLHYQCSLHGAAHIFKRSERDNPKHAPSLAGYTS